MAEEEIKHEAIGAEAGAQPEADGYYGEDDMSDEELDLSFLDEEEAAGEQKTDDTAGEATSDKPSEPSK
jgi:hypothetical protein